MKPQGLFVTVELKNADSIKTLLEDASQKLREFETIIEKINNTPLEVAVKDGGKKDAKHR